MDISEYLSTLPLAGFKAKSFTLFDAVDEIANVVAVKLSARAAMSAKTDTFIIFRNFIKILLLSSKLESRRNIPLG
jgi:hypothetical protein